MPEPMDQRGPGTRLGDKVGTEGSDGQRPPGKRPVLTFSIAMADIAALAVSLCRRRDGCRGVVALALAVSGSLGPASPPP